MFSIRIHHQKLFSLLLVLLIITVISVLTGCSRSQKLDFTVSSTEMEIKYLDEDLTVRSAGRYDFKEDTVLVSEACLNGSSDYSENGYLYDPNDVIPQYADACTYCKENSYTARGILIYHGFAYLTAEGNGTQYMIPISPDTAFADIITYSYLLQKAQKRQQANKTSSGGTGLAE